MESTVLVAIIGVAGGVVGSALTAFFNRRHEAAEAGKSDAEAEKAEADANEQVRVTVMLLLEPLKKRIFELECEVDTLKRENSDLKRWSEALVQQVISLGAQPTQMSPAANEPTTKPRNNNRRSE